MQFLKNVKTIVIIASLSFALMELGSGYYLFQTSFRGSSALYSVANEVFDLAKVSGRPRSIEDSPNHVLLKKQVNLANPFVNFNRTIGYKYHPLIDFTGVHSLYKNRFKLDYFGFRNNEDLYFQPKRRKLVVMTGGSELAGYSHRTTIAQNLEEILNKECPGQYQVLNLAMNSYTVSNEINAYIHLAYHLKPDMVISHSGSNDFGYGTFVPPPFKKLGFIYLKHVEYWLPRLYNLQKSFDYVLDYTNAGNEHLFPSYVRNIAKYEKIVTTNGGQFLLGVQGGNLKGFYSPEVASSLRNLASKRKGIFFPDNTGLKYIDHVHSTEESAKIIASAYAKRILAETTFKALP